MARDRARSFALSLPRSTSFSGGREVPKIVCMARSYGGHGWVKVGEVEGEAENFKLYQHTPRQ